MKYDSDMDSECISLCDALNQFPGIRTTGSCCGHGKDTFMIFFKTETLWALPRVLYWFDPCHSGIYGWTVTVSTDCAMSPVKFTIEGPKDVLGEKVYKQADEIAALMVKYINEDK